MKNKKGFTLIELLAVIVVLAIIALITIPQILGMVGSSKKKAAVSSIDNYVDSINKLNAVKMADNEYNFLDYKDVFETGFDDNDLNEVKTKGTKPDYVYFEYDQHKKVVKEGKFCINEVSVDYINGKAVESENDYCNKEIVPGLYDNKNNLIVSWDSLVNDYGMDLDWPHSDAVGRNCVKDENGWYENNYSNGQQTKNYIPLENITSGAPKFVFAKNNFENLSKLVLPSDLGEIPFYLFGSLQAEIDIIIPAGITKINGQAFVGSKITGITIGPDVKEISYDVFHNTPNLKKVIIPDNVEILSSWGGFYHSGVEYLKIGRGITEIPSSFCQYCEKLKTVELSSNVKRINQNAFSSSGITNIKLPEGLEKIESYAFNYAPNLKRIELPNSLTKLGGGAFENTGLQELKIGTGLTEIDYSTFENTKLKRIDIPGNIKKIAQQAFIYTNASEINLGNGVEEIGPLAFCHGNSKDATIKKINIPSSVKKIGSTAFKTSDVLESVIFEDPNNWTLENSCTPVDVSTTEKVFELMKKYGDVQDWDTIIYTMPALRHWDNIADCK